MKTRREERNVTTNAGESRQFTIAANGKAFEILIAGLYADKIQSITREIWANALDGHQARGCPSRPFEVTFPSTFDSVFRVRDFGTSLSHNEVMELYTTIFLSTKEDTNDATGKFGLGSKAPFAYTDTFSITTVNDGIQRHYATMIGEDGIPTINFMGENDTKEENGVEVAFPIATNDVEAFRTAAQRVSYGFDVKPTIKNTENTDYTWPEFDKSITGTGWFFFAGSPLGYNVRAFAKMGCVLYPIDVSAMESLSQAEKEFLGSNMVIDFPIGSLEISASRESLSYGRNEPTEATIKKRIGEIIGGWTKSALKDIAAADTLFEAVTLRNNATGYEVLGVFKRHIESNAKWNGTQVFSNIMWELTDAERHLRGIYIDVMGRASLARKSYRFSGSKEFYLRPSKGTHVVVEDISPNSRTSRAPSRIKKFKEDLLADGRPCSQIVWIRFSEGKNATAQLLHVLGLLEGADSINMVSELELPARVKRSSLPKKPAMLRTAPSGNYFNRLVSQDEDGFKKGGFYVPLLRGSVLYQQAGKIRKTNSSDIFAILVNLGAIDKDAEMYGVPGTYHKKFERADNWINLFQFAEDYLSNDFDGDSYAEYITSKEISVVAHSFPFFRLLDGSAHKMAGTIDKAIDYFLNANTIACNAYHENLANFYRYVNTTADEVDAEHLLRQDANKEAQEYVDAVVQEYPMISVIMEMGRATNFSVESLDKLVDYVHMCDADNSKSKSIAA